MTIYERALELIPDQSVIGLGSGRTAAAFVQALGERVRAGRLMVRGVPTSEKIAAAALEAGIPLVSLADVEDLAIAIDGADEVDPHLDLIKGYGGALVREKIVAAAARRLIILVGEDKLVPRLGTRGKLPIEVIPFGLPLVQRRLRELGHETIPSGLDDELYVSDNGNHILDCRVGPLENPSQLEKEIAQIPGVVDTGLFLQMAEMVLVGDSTNFRLLEERRAKRH